MYLANIFVFLLGLIFCNLNAEGACLETRPQCDKDCSRGLDFVCAQLNRENGKNLQCTFPSECELEVLECKTKEKWVIISDGKPCKSYDGECQQIFPKPTY